MLRFASILAGLFLLGGCDTPKVGFKYTDVKTLSVAGHGFKVFFNDTHAQSVRLNNVRLKSLRAGADAGLIAIERATGCEIKRVHKKSDQILIIARIKC